MRLLYTDVANHLTTILSREAQTYADQGYRVFYIAPNSLSFEKERQVLSSLPQRASFAITVTRFGQLARYLSLSTKIDPSLDDIGLTMVFYKVLTQLADEDLKLYGLLRTDAAFIQQLLASYKEWQSAAISWEDLEGLTSHKLADLQLIFSRVDQVLAGLELATLSPISQLSASLVAGQVAGLEKTVVLFDGFTRFTVEEEVLITQLNQACHEVVIATYASQSSYASPYSVGNLYQASISFLGQLAKRFETRPTYISMTAAETAFSRLSQVIDHRLAYRQSDFTISDSDRAAIQLWQATTVKAELEEVARQIRTKLHQGYRYKDMLVLLGDVEAYQLQLGQLFEAYAIPYYLGKAESMADHPLVQVIDSLDRLLRYNYRAEDLLNLLKSGLLGTFDQLAVDRFDQYVTYANLKGQRAFARPFKKTNGRYDLDQLNQTRATMMSSLLPLLNHPITSCQELLQALLVMFEQLQLRDNLTVLAQAGSQLEADKHEQVWKTFCQLLEQLQLIFGQEELAVSEFLGLLRAGMLSATYRVVPATLDVVNVNSYQLIEPHTKPFVFAIGLSQSNFPEILQNVSLLTDEERLEINAHLSKGQLELPSQDNLARNNYTFVSLLNSATQELVLSSPTLLGETEEVMSSYLLTLAELGLTIEPKRGQADGLDDVGTYRSLLGRLVEAYRTELFDPSMDQTRADDWGVLVRRLRRKMAEQGLVLPLVSHHPKASPISTEALAVRYPLEEPLRLSASSLSIFYDNEYKYFLTQVLRLQEDDNSLPDARHHGLFFHRVFELVTKDRTARPFDQKLAQALAQAGQEPELATVYDQNAQTRLTREVLTEMIKSTARLLSQDSPVRPVAEEASFGLEQVLASGRRLLISGKIDRLDELVTSSSYGVVDYKSSDKRFKLVDVYNKLTPQLLTYLMALQEAGLVGEAADIFGAMYLHVHQPVASLAKTSSLDDILVANGSALTYQGLFAAEHTLELGQSYASKASSFSREELAVLLAYNRQLYASAAERILSGQFAINPYTADGRSVAGDQLKSITRFEADQHLSQARRLVSFPRQGQRDLVLGAMAERLQETEEDKYV